MDLKHAKHLVGFFNVTKGEAIERNVLSLLLRGSSCLYFILETSSVKEGERSWQRNTFCLWTEIICLLFYSWQQKLNHEVSNVHIKGLKGWIGVLLSLCQWPVLPISFPFISADVFTLSL